MEVERQAGGKGKIQTENKFHTEMKEQRVNN